MQSSPGVSRSRVPPSLWLAAIPFAALALSAALAFGSAMSMRQSNFTASPANVSPRFSYPNATPQDSTGAGAGKTSSLWATLEPLAIDADTAAVLGFAIVVGIQLLRRRPRPQA